MSSFIWIIGFHRDLRRKLFGTSKRRSWSHSPSRSRSRSRSISPRYRDLDYHHRGHDYRYRDGWRYNGRHDEYDRGSSGRHQRRYSRSRSPTVRRKESSRREDSVERRAKIEQWNSERENQEAKAAGNPTGDQDNVYEENHGHWGIEALEWFVPFLHNDVPPTSPLVHGQFLLGWSHFCSQPSQITVFCAGDLQEEDAVFSTMELGNCYRC